MSPCGKILVSVQTEDLLAALTHVWRPWRHQQQMRASIKLLTFCRVYTVEPAAVPRRSWLDHLLALHYRQETRPHYLEGNTDMLDIFDSTRWIFEGKIMHEPPADPIIVNVKDWYLMKTEHPLALSQSSLMILEHTHTHTTWCLRYVFTSSLPVYLLSPSASDS